MKITTHKSGAIHIQGENPHHLRCPKTDLLFCVGEKAVYDSYNLIYLGKITKITQKTVTIMPDRGGRSRRMTVEQFYNKNYDFDMEYISKNNTDCFHHI